MKRVTSILSIVLGLAVLTGLYFMEDINRAVTAGSQVKIEEEIQANTLYGQLYLSVEGLDTQAFPKILINGKIMGYIDTQKITLDIQNGDVVEIDSRGIEKPATVTIAEKSNNVLTECKGRSVRITGNIHNLGSFVIKQ